MSFPKDKTKENFADDLQDLITELQIFNRYFGNSVVSAEGPNFLEHYQYLETMHEGDAVRFAGDAEEKSQTNEGITFNWTK